MFNCIKTGFYASLGDGNFLYGDAFGMDGLDWPDEPNLRPNTYLLLRITSMSSEPPDRVHIALRTWSHWFEEFNGKTVGADGDLTLVWRPCSTLIASPGEWSWLGYEGVAP